MTNQVKAPAGSNGTSNLTRPKGGRGIWSALRFGRC